MTMILEGNFVTWWPFNTFGVSGLFMELRFGILLGLFLPYMLIELALRTSFAIVLRIGMVFSWHLPF